MTDLDRYPYSAIIDRPPLTLPGNARIAVFIVPNVEYLEWLPPANPLRSPYPGAAPNLPAFQARDYGNRVALWRLFELFDDLGIKTTASVNAAVFEHFPLIAEEMAKRDWDYQSHGLYNTRFAYGMDEDMEREMIGAVIDIVRKATGKTISGWLGPALTTTVRTPDLLAEAGVKYWADMFHDDEPTEVSVSSGRLISLPYSFEVNSGVALGGQAQTGEAFGRFIMDQFDVLYAEGATAPKVMAVCLHPFAVAAPSRLKYLRQALEYILGHSGVWQATAGDIAEWYYANHFGKRLPLAAPAAA
ncbi:MAG: polysaccharide deacetylase family protein [Devosia sp.]